MGIRLPSSFLSSPTARDRRIAVLFSIVKMTRVSVYSGTLVAFVAATAMTIAAIATPHWVSYTVTTTAGDHLSKHIGLHKSCSTLDDPPCRNFPYKSLCQEGERYFCSMWRSVGFLVVMKGGKYKRETGWPFITSMLAIVSATEFVVFAIVAYLYDNDDQFTVPGWNLDVSWILSTVSASVCALAGAGLAASAYLLPPE